MVGIWRYFLETLFKMRKIKRENIEIGDFIYIIENIFTEKRNNRKFILKILSNIGDVTFWKLKDTQEPSIFDTIEYKDDYLMIKEDWGNYNLYRLNKEEISKFIKLNILENLK